jgi:hypothetical protein
MINDRQLINLPVKKPKIDRFQGLYRSGKGASSFLYAVLRRAYPSFFMRSLF